MRDVLREQERRGEVVQVTRLTRVRPERDGVQAFAFAQFVQRVQVSVDVVGVVRERGVVRDVPLLWRAHVLRGPALGLGLVVHHVESL